MNLNGLEPATEYRFELIAVLTTGAETDLVEAIFVTAGEKAEVEKSQCALSYEALINSNDIITACDFEGKKTFQSSEPIIALLMLSANQRLSSQHQFESQPLLLKRQLNGI